MDIREAVFQALDNALEGGYEDVALKWNLLEVAIDLGTYDSDLEGLDPNLLIPHILDWRIAHQ